MKALISFYLLSLMLLLAISCQKNKQYYVFDDDKDKDNKEYQRLKNREDKKTIDSYLKEMATFMSATGMFNEDISKFEYEVERSEKGKSGTDVTIRVKASLLDENTIRVQATNRSNFLVDCGTDICQFDFSKKDHENLFRTFVLAKNAQLVDFAKGDIKEDKIKLKVEKYEYRRDKENYTQVNYINYELKDDIPSFLVFGQREYSQTTIEDGKQVDSKSYNMIYKTKRVNATNNFPTTGTLSICDVRINSKLPEEDFKSFFFFHLVNCR